MRRQVARHRETAIQFLKFGTVGVAGFCVDYTLLNFGINVLHLGHYGGALFSYPFSATFTWLGNRHFTFRGKREGSAHAQWMRFLTVCAVGLVINRGAYSLLTATLPLFYEYPALALLGGTGAGMFFNFFLSRRVVFR